MSETLLLAVLFFGAAVLYASVGHAGASAYLAAMALVGTQPSVMRPTALTLNLVVASIVTYRFARAGHLELRPLVPLVIGSAPFAFLGGTIHLAPELYRPLLAVVLVAGALRLAVQPTRADPTQPGVPWLPALGAGAAIGLLAGLSGTGGGIFLTPLLVLAGWTTTRQAAALSGAFILVNSVAGLAGIAGSAQALPPPLPIWVAAVAVGGLIGSHLGAQRFTVLTLRRLLAVVMVIAAAKFLFLG
jgi:uncharacterized membrane protein YfcA